MDTIFLCPEKRLWNIFGIAVNFAVVSAFIFTQSIFVTIMANDLFAKVTNPIIDTGQASMQIINEVSSEAESKKFDEKIKKKYPNAIIADVDKGIKHIKLTKYDDDSTVKVNVVEIDNKFVKQYTLTLDLASETLHHKRTI